jgi:predicted glycosyltransferase
MNQHVVFCTSCRIALGKLRRTTNIVEALRNLNPRVRITLLANSGPKGVAKGLSQRELALYDDIEFAIPNEMADRLKMMAQDLTVVGTMKIRNIHTVSSPLCLILREVIPEQLKKFRLREGRKWDLVVLPHPKGQWNPNPEIIQAKRIESVGWIYRQPATAPLEVGSRTDRDNPATVLVTTGGGSGEDRGNDTQSDVANLISGLRETLEEPLKVVQVIGPRDWKKNSIQGIDGIIMPGPDLHNHFHTADLVISAVGYNTVLELACTDVPALLVPVPRYTDDQQQRAELWGKKLGMNHDPSRSERSIEWMAKTLEHRQRRPAVPLGRSGAERCATLIDGLLGES